MSKPIIALFINGDEVSGYHDESTRTPATFITVVSIRSDDNYIDIHLNDLPSMIALGERIAAEGRRLLAEAQPIAPPDTLTADQQEESFSRR